MAHPRTADPSAQAGGRPPVHQRRADADGAWHHFTTPACLAPAASGQRVELGLVRVRPDPDGVVVVWLRCL